MGSVHSLEQARMDKKDSQGHTQILNTVLEAAAKGRFSQHQYQVLLAVFRKTFGWQKEWDVISGSQLEEMTKLYRQDCSKALNRLIELNVIERKGSSRSAIRINPDIDAWESPEKASKKARVSGKRENHSMSDNSTHSTNDNSTHTKERNKTISNSNELDCSDSPSEHDQSSDKKSLKYPACPHKEILALWAEVIPETVQHDPSAWKSDRAGYKNLAKRWKAGFVNQKRDGSGTWYNDKQSALEWWARLLRYMRKSDFLINDCRPFCLEWAVKPANFNKILEGVYHNA